MIIKFGYDKDSAYGSWANCKDVFVSRPFFKILLDCGVGFYILNSYKWNWIPKFSFRKSIDSLECGFTFAKLLVEIQYNKAFAK